MTKIQLTPRPPGYNCNTEAQLTEQQARIDQSAGDSTAAAIPACASMPLYHSYDDHLLSQHAPHRTCLCLPMLQQLPTRFPLLSSPPTSAM
jgi:hypothetical protein